MHMAYVRAMMSIYLAQKAHRVLLLAEEVSIPEEYADFSEVCFKEFAAVLLNHLNINKYVIDLEPGAPISFVWKPDRSFHLCVDSCGQNNLIIKNQYPLPLIGKSLDRLGKVKWFTQLNLTSVFHHMMIKKGGK